MPQTKETPFEIVMADVERADKLGEHYVQLSMAALRDLLKDHAALIEAHDALAAEVDAAPHSAENGHGLRFTVPDLDYIYKFVKARAEKDPAILELLTRRPELRIKVERQTIQMDDSQLIGRIARLLHEGWFAQPKNGPAVQKELKRRGCEQPTTNLYKPLNKLTEMGFLTLESDGYREVAEMKALVQKA